MGLFSKKKGKDSAAEDKAEPKKSGGFFKGLMKSKTKDKQAVALAVAAGTPQAETSACELEPSASQPEPAAAQAEASAAAALPSVEDSAEADAAMLHRSGSLVPACEALGISGAGFAAAVGAHPEAVAQILKAAQTACSSAESALGNRHNCLALAETLREAVTALDAHGQNFSQLPMEKVEKLAEQFAAGAALVGEAGAEGWLLRLAFGAGPGPEAFSDKHAAVAEIVQGCVPALSSRRLATLDYRDTSRALRRLLKRLGGGSAVAGLRVAVDGGCDGAALGEVAQLLEVPPQAVLAELEACEDLDEAAAGAGSILLNGSIRDRECAVVFGTYAASEEGCAAMNREGFARMLEDLGLVGAEDPASVDQLFAKACGGSDSAGLGYDAFCEYYQTLPLSLHRQAIRAEMGVEAEHSLRAAFSQYAAFGAGPADAMDSQRFAKLCKESGLSGGSIGLAPQAPDIIFTQAKPRDGRRLDFDGFISALALAANQAGCSLEAVVKAVLAVEGPMVNATQADKVPLHDDRSLYTGVYRNGMSVVDRPADGLAALVSREDPPSPTKAAALSRSGSGVASHGSTSHLVPLSLSRTASGARSSSGTLTPRSCGATPTGAAAAMAASAPLSRSGSGLRPASLGSCPGSGAGTPRASAVSRGGAPAQSLRLSLHKLQQQPQGSAASAGRKGQGAAGSARGSNRPTPREARAANSSRRLEPAAKATPRGGKPKVPDSHPVTPSAYAVSPNSGEVLTTPPAPSDIYEPDLRRAFEAYASFGMGAAGDAAGLDGARFAKLCRESGLLTRGLNPTRVDLVFAKVSGKARRIDFGQFLCALAQLAEARGCSVVEVKRAIASSEGPQRRGTTPESVRLHDDKSTFTGVYARGGPSTADDKVTLEALTSRLSPRNTAPPPRAKPSPRG